MSGRIEISKRQSWDHGKPLRSALRLGWDSVWGPLPLFWVGLAGVAGVWFLVEAFVIWGHDFGRVNWWFWHIAYFYLASFPEIFLVQIALDRSRDSRPSLLRACRNFQKVNTWFLVKVFSILSIAGGLLMIAIPGIIFGIRLQLMPYCILDEQVDFRKAIRMSFRLTRGVGFPLFAFDLFLLLFNAFGMALFGFGLLLTIPVTLQTMAYVYLERRRG